MYADRRLIGDESYLRAIFDASIRILNPAAVLRGTRAVHLQITNNSEIDFALTQSAPHADVAAPDSVTLYAFKTVLLTIRGVSKAAPGKRRLELSYTVTNLLPAPEEGLSVRLGVDATFVAP